MRQKSNLFQALSLKSRDGDGVVFRRCDVIAKIANFKEKLRTVRGTRYERCGIERSARCSDCRGAVEA